MTIVLKASALALGVLLYFLEEFLIGYLSATTVPRAYFDLFGPHKVVALFLEEAALVAFPALLLALGWGMATTRLIRMSPYQVAGWVVAGLVIAWFARLLQEGLALESNPLTGEYPFLRLMRSFLVPPIWGVLTSLSAPLGVLLAGLVAKRSDRMFRRTASQPLH